MNKNSFLFLIPILIYGNTALSCERSLLTEKLIHIESDSVLMLNLPTVGLYSDLDISESVKIYTSILAHLNAFKNAYQECITSRSITTEQISIIDQETTNIEGRLKFICNNYNSMVQGGSKYPGAYKPVWAFQNLFGGSSEAKDIKKAAVDIIDHSHNILNAL